MCYSAQIKADYARFVREYGAKLSIKDFYDLFWRRLADRKIQVPRGVEAAFATPLTDEEREVQALIARHAAAHAEELREELARQQERLASAQAKLERKPTKTAENERRIARNKIGALEDRLAQMQDTELTALDLRMFPGSYVPVMVMEHGQRMFKPMRYRCRPWHVPASFDAEYPGNYNARRDSLRKFWRQLFGTHHGVVVLSAFYEHVPRHLALGRQADANEAMKTLQVEFKPDPPQDLLAACIWSRWSAPGEPDLLSFALITDDPPPEILAVGHDRCMIHRLSCPGSSGMARVAAAHAPPDAQGTARTLDKRHQWRCDWSEQRSSEKNDVGRAGLSGPCSDLVHDPPATGGFAPRD